MASGRMSSGDRNRRATLHESILRRASQELLAMPTPAPLGPETDEQVCSIVLSEVWGMDQSEIQSNFEDFLMPEEIDVFQRFASTMREVGRKLVLEGGALYRLTRDEPDWIAKTMSGRSGSSFKAAQHDFSPMYGSVVAYVMDVIAPRSAMALAAEINLYFAYRCDEVDQQINPGLSKAVAAFDEMRYGKQARLARETGAAMEAGSALAAKYNEAADRYAQSILSCLMDRSSSVSVKNGALDFKKDGIRCKPRASFDRALDTPDALVLILCSPFEILGDADEIARLSGLLRVCASEVSEFSIHRVAVFGAPGIGGVSPGQMDELRNAGIEWESLGFFSAILPDLLADDSAPDGLLEKIVFNGLGDPSPQEWPLGSLARDKVGRTLDDRMSWNASRVHEFVRSNEYGDRMVGGIVNPIVRLLLTPETFFDKDEKPLFVRDALDAVGQFGSPSCDLTLVEQAKKAFDAYFKVDKKRRV